MKIYRAGPQLVFTFDNRFSSTGWAVPQSVGYRFFRLQPSYLSATSHTGRKSCRAKSLYMKRFWLQDYRVQEFRLPSSHVLSVMYCVRVSLWTVNIFLAQHLREGTSWITSVYLCSHLFSGWRRHLLCQILIPTCHHAASREGGKDCCLYKVCGFCRTRTRRRW